MSRLAVLSASLLLLVAPPASAAPMPPADHEAISTLVDSFVKDVIMSRDLPAGWALAGPNLRGGTTRAAWDRGTGVTVQRFSHVIGNDFRNSWSEQHFSPGRAEITVNLRTGGEHPLVIAAPTVLLKEHGRWVVDIFYAAGFFRSEGRGSCAHASCKVTGVNDLGPGSSAHDLGLPSKDRGRWMWVGLGGVGGLFFGTLATLLLYTRIRDRRARQSYETHTGRRQPIRGKSVYPISPDER